MMSKPVATPENEEDNSPKHKTDQKRKISELGDGENSQIDEDDQPLKIQFRSDIFRDKTTKETRCLTRSDGEESEGEKSDELASFVEENIALPSWKPEESGSGWHQNVEVSGVPDVFRKYQSAKS